MAHSCRCGSPVRYLTVALACIECGTECCPCCTLMFESAPYCVACAEALFEDAVGPIEGKSRVEPLLRA